MKGRIKNEEKIYLYFGCGGGNTHGAYRCVRRGGNLGTDKALLFYLLKKQHKTNIKNAKSQKIQNKFVVLY